MNRLLESASSSPRAELDHHTALPTAPYPGIRPFRFTDRPLFFGREDDVEAVLRAIKLYRGVLLFGESGTGKSSLVNAGLLPAMIGAGYTPDRMRVSPVPGGEIVVERMAADPENKDFLPSTFIVDGGGTTQRLVLSTEAFEAKLKQLPLGAKAFLVFDQFEEFVTLFEDAPRGDDIARARAAEANLLDMFTRLLREQRLPFKLLFVFRDDYLAKLDKLFVRYPRLTDQFVRLTSLTTEALPKVIGGPFEEYPDGFEHPLPEPVRGALVDALTRRSIGDLINPSEVQVASRRLWESSDPARVLEERNVDGLLEDYMLDALRQLPSEQQEAASALLRHLVTSGGARNVISEDDLLAHAQEDAGMSEPILRAALHSLENDARLIRRELRRNVTYYELISEFLIDYIRRLRAERLEQKLREQDARHKAEQENAQRMLLLEQSQRQMEAEDAEQRAALERAEAARKLESERANRLARQKRSARQMLIGVILGGVILVSMIARAYEQQGHVTTLEKRQTADSLEHLGAMLATHTVGDTVAKVSQQMLDSIAVAGQRRVDSLRLNGAGVNVQLQSIQQALNDERRAHTVSDSLGSIYEAALLKAGITIASLRDTIAQLQGLLMRSASTPNAAKRSPPVQASGPVLQPPAKPAPGIVSLAVFFHTNNDDKDNDTRVQIELASLANGVSVGTSFNDNSDNVITLALYKTPTPVDAVTGKPITICIYPVGHDTWRFNYSLVARLETGASLTFAQPNVVLNEKTTCATSTLKF